MWRLRSPARLVRVQDKFQIVMLINLIGQVFDGFRNIPSWNEMFLYAIRYRL